MSEATHPAIARLFNAVSSRDIDRVVACFTTDATYRNMPHPPAVGHPGIRSLMGPILEASERVRWEVRTAAYSAERAWVERVDRFWIGGEEYAVACHGVFDIDPETGLIRALRDYVDLGEWRARVAPALDRAGRPGRN